MDYFILATIGIVMGLFGGLLGIGGSVVMIPALVFAYGENQHLYQASAMICNFFVGIGAVIVHKKAEVLAKDVIKWMIPAAAVGILIGVAISNSSVFARENSYLLARILGAFLIYVVVFHCLKLVKRTGNEDGLDMSGAILSPPRTIIVGLLCAIPAGLLGIGGGIFYVQVQHAFLKIPLKRAIGNSAATIAAVALIGAFYKNITLSQHNIQIIESVKIAACIIPGAVIGAFLGGRAMHKLPVNIVRIVFIIFAALACYKLLTVAVGA